ncbi:Membrane primary amine oxidase [Lachnellula suecica]|uniref:Amine oxidase n=1 Tax=Lachnellula suecica TaxID=602035 RepID=A0A8T9C4U3_9HELO|nr:Membrane primary amine oxidase [Lachnellula suecica]
MAGFVKKLALVTALFGLISESRPGPTFHKSKNPRGNRRQSTSCGDTPADIIVEAPQINLWKGLTNEEADDLLEWLYDSKQGLNLTTADKAGPWDNTVGVTEILFPNKTDSLAYLDRGEVEPVRNARVGLFFGATPNPYMQNFIVGPIPVSPETTIEPLNYIYTKEVGKTPNYRADLQLNLGYYKTMTSTIADITLDLLGVSVTGNTDDTGFIQPIDPLQKEGDRIIDWITFGVKPTLGYDDATILIAGMWMKFDITGRDFSKWTSLGVFYNNIFYESTDELRAAWEKPGFVNLTKATDGEFAATDRQGDELPYETLPPPASVETSKRYAIDKGNKYVTWMDFAFYMAFDRDTGLKFFNMKYKGERIIYELGVQEAHSHYAGSDPFQSGTSYLDSFYGLGTYASSLVPGWDCPAAATYLDNVIHDDASTTTLPDTICIFEQDAGYPLARHTTANYVTVSKNTQLVVRWIATVGNYDYLMDYVFSLDGTIEVKVRASGYIQGTYYADNEDYGYKIHDALSGSMHDHVINYKLDMDINGTANSFQKVDIVPVTTSYPWSTLPRNTMKLSRSFLATEDEGKLNWPTNAGSMYLVVNKDSPNAYGELRGYRIAPNLGSPIYLTVQNSSVAQLSNRFATNHLFVTKQKDTELKSTSAWNGQDPGDPLVDFDTFFDGESLDQEDLVIWFNLGMHHVPHTGDIPNTVFSTSQSGISISPHNYLLRDPSRQSSHIVYINKTASTLTAETYGGEVATCVFDLAQLYPDLTSFPASSTNSAFPEPDLGGGS